MLVAFAGPKGSGKDTGADYLVEKYNFVKVSFADPLKAALKELFMFSDEQLYGTIEQKESPDDRWFGCTPRKAMQFVGTDLFRNHLDEIMPGIGKNIFVYRFKLWYESELKKNPDLKIVVADVRFANEADHIKNLGGSVIQLNRPNIIATDTHQSENEFQNIISDYVINNDSTIYKLWEKLDEIVHN